MWRDATLQAAWRRFHEVFAQVVPYVCDEHEWAFLIGCREAGPDPVTEMVDRFAMLPVPPATLDAAGLRSRAVPPFRLRAGS